MIRSTPLPELAVPQPVRAVIGAFALTGFILFFVLLAVENLLNWAAVIPSLIWLSLVSAVLFGFCKERGISQVLTEILGAFARKQFARAIPHDGGQSEIQFGYRILGYQRLHLAIPLDKIKSVNWSTGQATHMAGRDMNDWSVALWYDHDDPARSEEKKGLRKPDQEVYIVGPTGKKENTAAFGRSFVDYLRESGASLVAGDDDCTFVRRPNTP
jgi:hypothetical protein